METSLVLNLNLISSFCQRMSLHLLNKEEVYVFLLVYVLLKWPILIWFIIEQVEEKIENVIT